MVKDNIIDKKAILDSIKEWFTNKVAENHKKNLEKIINNPTKLHINPFLANYLANFFTGNNSAESIAKAVLYPHILGTSINTSFGTNLQKFIPSLKVLLSNDAVGSTTSGIDIEFVDQLDSKKKYCQLKAGVQTINKDDVTTIHNHFKKIINLASANGSKVTSDCLVVGVLYGERTDLNANYKNLEYEYGYNVFVGKDFWHRLTGEDNFYFELSKTLSIVANEFDSRDLIARAIDAIAKTEKVIKLSEGNKLLY